MRGQGPRCHYTMGTETPLWFCEGTEAPARFPTALPQCHGLVSLVATLLGAFWGETPQGSTQVAQEDTEAHVCSQARPRPVPPTSFLPVPSPGAAEP